MKILGVDPGIDATGYACIEADEDYKSNIRGRQISVLCHGVISPQAEQAIEEKFKFIHAKLKKIVKATQPDVVVVEDIYSHAIHPKTGLKMGHVKGVIELAVSQTGIKLYNLTATKVKRVLLGRGNASKEQIAKMIENTFQIKDTSTRHESDALAIALAYLLANNKATVAS